LKIRISEDVTARYRGSTLARAQFLMANANKWVNVLTDSNYLDFTMYSILWNGIILKIMDRDVSEVEDDMREGKSKCERCGGITITGAPCPNGCGKEFMRQFLLGSKPNIQCLQDFSDVVCVNAFGLYPLKRENHNERDDF
jgi:hypothetical protein